MKRRILLVGLVIVLAVVAIGCGGGRNNLDGRWENIQSGTWIEFSRNNFTSNDSFASIYGTSTSGTFSVSGTGLHSQIEFVGDDGRVASNFFSRTENTITIGSGQFTRVN